jgi:hypothetical protein
MTHRLFASSQNYHLPFLEIKIGGPKEHGQTESPSLEKAVLAPGEREGGAAFMSAPLISLNPHSFYGHGQGRSRSRLSSS